MYNNTSSLNKNNYLLHLFLLIKRELMNKSSSDVYYIRILIIFSILPSNKLF